MKEKIGELVTNGGTRYYAYENESEYEGVKSYDIIYKNEFGNEQLALELSVLSNQFREVYNCIKAFVDTFNKGFIVGSQITQKRSLDSDAYAAIHDTFLSATGTIPESSVVSLIYADMPEEIKLKTGQRDWNDTEVRDDLYKFIGSLLL